MADLKQYSSEKLMRMNQPQLKQTLEKFKKQHMPLWKVGLFVGYNGLALTGMCYYAMKLRGKRVQPSLKNRHNLTVFNMFRKGSIHALIMISLYTAGLFVVCHNRISLAQIRKLTQIQTTYDSFGLRFDPSYQQYLLFARMRKFDLSEELISQIRDQLQSQKNRLIEEKGLLPETVDKIRYCEELFNNRAKQVR